MRRKPVEKFNVSLVHNEVEPWLFWRKCVECGDEVRREPITEIIIQYYNYKDHLKLFPTNSPFFDTYYFCRKCCETHEKAVEFFKEKYLSLYERKE